MKEIRAVICDDEKMAQDIVASALKTCFSKYGYVLRLDRYTDPRALARDVGDSYQIAFLDIDMPGMDGIDLAAKILAVSPRTSVIFISNCEDRVFDSFAVHPFGFVRKSSFLKDVESVVKLYIASQKGKEDDGRFIEIRTREGLSRFPVSEITYIECDRSIQKICFRKDPPVETRSSMALLEESLQGCGFLRVHQGYLVNYLHIRKIDTDACVMTDGTEIPVSRRKRKEIYTEYMRLSRIDSSTVNVPDKR